RPFPQRNSIAYIFALNIAALFEAATELGRALPIGREHSEESHNWQRPLLCARGRRPRRSHRAANEGNELAPSHWDRLKPWRTTLAPVKRIALPDTGSDVVIFLVLRHVLCQLKNHRPRFGG